MKKNKRLKKGFGYLIIFAAVNLAAILALSRREINTIDSRLAEHGAQTMEKVDTVMEHYTHSFQLFSHMMTQEIKNHPNPDDIWDYLKSIDSTMSDIEGETFDGLYMYYQGRYLYSWDTPYSEYENTGYVATERPWYRDAAAGKGEIVFTPPYMSYANHYILSTVSQLQPDGKTVFAYDIKMGDIQNLVSAQQAYDSEQMLLFDSNGTIIGSTDTDYLGGCLYATVQETEDAYKKAQDAFEKTKQIAGEQREKLQEQVQSASAFHTFRQNIDSNLSGLLSQPQKTVTIKLGNQRYLGYLTDTGIYHCILLVPLFSMLKATVQVWLLPLLILEILLIYILSRISKEQKNRELKAAYVELGQTQKRLEIALSAAKKAAAIDDLTGMMNFKSFRKGVSQLLEAMNPEDSGILIILDGDHFKYVNDNYGHTVGDEVIKLSAQMIIGRIRTIDLASRLHGDEFAIFVSKTDNYSVAKRIIADINSTLAEEAAKRNMPAITLSAGAVIARSKDNYTALAKTADAALYHAKETHNGAFSSADELSEN